MTDIDKTDLEGERDRERFGGREKQRQRDIWRQIKRNKKTDRFARRERHRHRE